MQFTIDKLEMLVGVRAVEKTLPAKTSTPILENICIVADGNGVTLMTNDLEMGTEATLRAFVIEQGSVCVDGKMFVQIINKMPNGDISVALEGGTLKISNKKAKAELSCISAADYPKMPDRKSGVEIKMGIDDFGRMVDGVIFCTDANSSNKLMQGINVDVANDTLTFTALDGHRIGVYKKGVANVKDVNATIPAKAMRIASKLSLTENVKIIIAETHAWFEVGDIVLNTRLITGKYFDVARLIELSLDVLVSVDRKDFIGSIDRAMTFVTNKKPIILDISGGTMNITIRDIKGGINDEYDVEHSGNDIRIGFDPTFLMDVLRVTDGDMVTLKMSNEKSPCIIDNENAGYKYVVLPVSIR